LHLGQPLTTTSRIDPRCRKRLALFVVLLLGVLFSGLVLLLWRDGPLFFASWEVPKPTSALLSPLERPG
jgi:hypothetical protein